MIAVNTDKTHTYILPSEIYFWKQIITWDKFAIQTNMWGSKAEVHLKKHTLTHETGHHGLMGCVLVVRTGGEQRTAPVYLPDIYIPPEHRWSLRRQGVLGRVAAH